MTALVSGARLVEPEQAWDAIAQRVVSLPAERAPLDRAVGRVLARRVNAVIDLPAFDRASMDGFAVRAQDTDGGELRIVGDIAAGDRDPAELPPGCAMAISTGAPLPPGADAVLRSELAVVREGVVAAAEPVTRGCFVRTRAEDVTAGAALAHAGEMVTVQRLASLAAAGIAEVHVRARPRVHVLVTGSLLEQPGTPPRAGSVFDANGIVLRHLVERAGGRVTDGGVVRDDPLAIFEAVTEGLNTDVLLVCGGVSAGPHDYVRPALRACGVDEIFWRVSIKPGRPLWFGRRDDTLVFGLPGNPLASLVLFLLFIEPLLRRMQGETTASARRVVGRLTEPAAAEDDRTTLLTARVTRADDGELLATPTTHRGSHRTGTLGESDAFIIVPREPGMLAAGDPVELLLTGSCDVR